jgi:predicted dehydrogenase
MQKIILVGLGFMGTMHAQIYAQLAKARIVGVVDIDARKAAMDLEKLGLRAPVFSSLKEAMDGTDATVVDICLPTDLHAPFALEAIRAGKNVFCEKPFALSVDEAKRVGNAAKRRGVFVQVGQCIRFWPEYIAFEKFVKSGKAGKLLSLSLQRRAGRPAYSTGDWLNDAARSGGAALDLHIHDTDFIHHLLGRPAAVTSVGTEDATGWSHIFTTYHFKDIAVTAEGGWNYPKNWGFQMAFQAVFENGAVEFDSGTSPTMVVTIGNGKKSPLPFKTPGAGESKTGSGNLSSLGGYYNELAAFIHSLESKTPPAIATATQATQSLATTLAEIQSARTGKTQRTQNL